MLLLQPGDREVDTWRENYPYDERMRRDQYEDEKRQLQIELLKLQKWTQANGLRHIILFEGRDAAGKGGTIKSGSWSTSTPRRPRRRAGEADRAGDHAVVLPALRGTLPGRR